MSLEHLVGHLEDSCKRGFEYKGGPTCNEKMRLLPAGHLYQFALLIEGARDGNGLYGICWHMASAILDVVPRETKGFVRSVLKHVAPRSIWSSDYREYCQQRLGKKMPHGEVWGPFRDRVLHGLREVRELDEDGEGAGLEDWPDEAF